MTRTEGLWDGYLPSEKAAEINRNRQQLYGDPTPNMEVLARLWSICFGVEINARQAAMGCVLLKCMREIQGGYDPEYLDNLEDMCGFTNVLAKAKEAVRGDRSEPTPAGEE